MVVVVENFHLKHLNNINPKNTKAIIQIYLR